MPKKRTAFLLLTICLFGIAVYFFIAAGSAKAALAVVSQKRIALDVDTRRLEERAAARKKESARLQEIVRSSKAHPNPPFRPSSAENFASLLEADPKLMALYLKDTIARLTRLNRPLFQKYQLSQTQIDKYEELQAERAMKLQDLEAATLAEKLSDTDPTIAEQRRQLNASFRNDLETVVGENAMHALDEGLPPAYVSIFNIALSPAMAPTPITTQQELQLEPILTAAIPQKPSGGQWRAE